MKMTFSTLAALSNSSRFLKLTTLSSETSTSSSAACELLDGPGLLKNTEGRCPICKIRVPAEVVKTQETPARVIMRRTCPEHGLTESVLASDARFYWLSKGSSTNGGCCGRNDTAKSCCTPQSKNNPFETLSTCLALIEIVQSCNLACPTCFANSPRGTGTSVDAVPLQEVQDRISGVIERKGKIEILQLSGGEPTLHPQFFELLLWAQSHPKIDYVLINTNGVKLARDEEFRRQMAEAAKRRKVQLYLQFDGLQQAGQWALRGADLRALRQEVISNAQSMDLPVTLAMTVTPDNLDNVWETLAFGLQYPHIQGITFQPCFESGRIPGTTSSGRTTPPTNTRLNTADILLALFSQSAGKLTERDFTPLPCGDPNCAVIGYLLRLPGGIRSISEFLDFRKLQGFLQNRVQYNLQDLVKCGCESEPLGEILRQLQLQASHTFRIMVKPFMDASTWDQDRIDRCCTHVIRPDGKLDSFCRYYSGFPDTKPAVKVKSVNGAENVCCGSNPTPV